MTWHIHTGDVGDILPTLPERSFDAVLSDPPYGLEFMGKAWDYDLPAPAVWRECLRVLKPGGYALIFGGTRTYHRLACAVEDAGFEIRDCMMWIYGSGFPKSLDISKSLDQRERNRWLGISKGIDNLDHSGILDIWVSNSNIAKSAGTQSQKNEIEIGINTQKNDSVQDNAQRRTNQEKSLSSAIVAELNFCARHHMQVENTPFVQGNVDTSTLPLQPNVVSVASDLLCPKAESRENIIAPLNVKELRSASQISKTRAAEALKTWCGKSSCSKQAGIAALCADLINDLKRIILSRSKTFRSLGTTRQMDCVSATSATITESMAALLISFMANTLKNEAIDKAAGAEREVVGTIKKTASADMCHNGWSRPWAEGKKTMDITAPATPEAQRWQGYGSALKPAYEPILLCRKPPDGTLAHNALTHGCGGLNIDGGRVASGDPLVRPEIGKGLGAGTQDEPAGRWPANLLHDGSAEACAGFPVTGPSKAAPRGGTSPNPMSWGDRRVDGDNMAGHDDNGGSAARFFYTAKSSPSERAGMLHPTMKPLELTRYLATLLKPPGDARLLVPFAGVGSEVLGAIQAGWDHVEGIELDADYADAARARIVGDAPLFGGDV